MAFCCDGEVVMWGSGMHTGVVVVSGGSSHRGSLGGCFFFGENTW